MTSKKLLLYTIAGILFTSVTGTLAHFVYDWSGQNVLAGLFTPVSESTWEHMKLLFFPMLLYGFFTMFCLHKDFPCISHAYPLGILRRLCHPGTVLHLFRNSGRKLHCHRHSDFLYQRNFCLHGSISENKKLRERGCR